MDAPYRTPAKLAPSQVPETLECWLRDGDSKRWVRALYVKLWITATACTFLAVSSARLAAIPGAVAGVLWASSEYRKRKGASVVFRVRAGRVRIQRGNSTGPLELELDEIHNVRLDTKTASKNLTMARADGVNTVFGASSNHNIDVDVSRIEVVLAGGQALLLSREFISGSLCAEQMRSIRLFLRGHGWKPADERATAD